jgi:hypothetical protein
MVTPASPPVSEPQVGEPTAWICDGCGRLFLDPQGDLHALRVSGALSCCPERKPLPLFTAAQVEARLSEVVAENEQARRYASDFLEAFVAKYCDPVPGFKPLPDLLGVLTQIDNATTVAAVLLARAEAAERKLDEARKVIEGLVTKLDEIEPHSNGVFEFYALHGFKYAGPNYAEELRAARTFLASLQP